MSKIIQLYSDKNKTIKAYPKTLASQVYMDDGQTTITSHLESIELNKASKEELNVERIRVDEIANKGTTVDVIERATKQEIDRQVTDGTIANLTIQDNSVTVEKMKFSKPASNLFNKNDIDVKSGFYLNTSTGGLSASVEFITSGYMLVEDVPKIFLKNARQVCFYGADKTFKNGKSLTPYVNTVVDNTSNYPLCRISWKTVNESLDTQQVNRGIKLLPYEEYRLIIDKDVLEDKEFNVDNVPNKAITLNKTDFVIIGKNKFDKASAIKGKFINPSNGQLADSASYCASDYIELEDTVTQLTENTQYWCAFYDENKMFISSVDKGSNVNAPRTIDKPTGARYIRTSTTIAMINSYQVEIGADSTPYEPYCYKFTRNSDDSTNGFNVEINLPSKIYSLVGQELNIYFDNVINDRDKKYDFHCICAIGGQFERGYRVVPATTGSYTFTFKVLKDGNEVAVKTTQLVVTGANVGNGVTKKMLIIGDSTTATVGGMVVQRIHTNFDSDVMNITTIGTKGTSPFNHEAISGWTARQMVSDPTSVFVYNGTFNFSNYMQTQGYSGLNYAFINLGINDLFRPTNDDEMNVGISEFIADVNTMVASIKAYDSNIKVAIALTIPPAYSQDAFGQYEGGNVRWRYKKNNFELVKMLIKTFDNRVNENIYVYPIHTNLDTVYNMGIEEVQVNARNTKKIERVLANGRVHPVESGYWQIADIYWYFLKSFEV